MFLSRHKPFLRTGFDLSEVGCDEVKLRTGKQANKRNIQFAHQAMLALFGEFLIHVRLCRMLLPNINYETTKQWIFIY